MGKTNPTDQHLDKFPTVSDFLDRNALIVSGLGLGTHFSLPTAQCAGLCGDDGITNRKPVLRFEYTYPTSDLARSLITDDLVAGSTDLEAALVGDWKGAHVNWHVERGPRLTADLASPVSKPQGLFFKLIGQGYHNTVYQKSLMWGEDRLYMVRSISKAFASTLLLVLQDRGVLSIDDRVGAYLSEYNDAPGLQDITIRMLLTHTAGFAPFMAQVGDNSPRALTDWTMSLRDSAREISRIPLVSSPGKEFHYTELGYQVAGAVAEVASGRPWYDIFRDFVAKPLDLRHTSWHNTFSPVENPPNPLIAVCLYFLKGVVL